MFINCQQLAIYSFQHNSHFPGSLSVPGFHLHCSQCKTALPKFEHHWSPIDRITQICELSRSHWPDITREWSSQWPDVTREWSFSCHERMILFIMSRENDPFHQISRENDPFPDVTREWSFSYSSSLIDVHQPHPPWKEVSWWSWAQIVMTLVVAENMIDTTIKPSLLSICMTIDHGPAHRHHHDSVLDNHLWRMSFISVFLVPSKRGGKTT